MSLGQVVQDPSVAIALAVLNVVQTVLLAHIADRSRRRRRTDERSK